MNDQHRIDVEQNKPERLELLRAQRLFYSRAKLYQNLFAVMALLLPAVGVLFGASYPDIRPFLGFGSIVVLLLDVGVISRKQREDCKRGAKVQEQFDTEVLKLDWNRLVAGGKVDAEDVRAITSKPITDVDRQYLENWYEVAIAKLPLPVGRIICQRTNVTYDMRVRKTYAGVLLGAAVLLFVGLTLLGLYQGVKVNDLILTMYLPALPLATFLLREHRKHGDTIETLTTIKAEVEKVWEQAITGTSFEDLTRSSRALQDAIYRHRASNPLVFDWLYDWIRQRQEDLTRHAVEKLVAEAQKKLNILEAQ
ncbi:S-4TM family putative pore-forming effector [Dechloromonas sp. ARDL1]|uniref:S-4TM family putative pore-forming effector n=1 Tax=Dechloromonas sp. ARDL1 TaxID=3322121 RepID=UPI003DA7704F